jgi:uncharacterized protein YcnI
LWGRLGLALVAAGVTVLSAAAPSGAHVTVHPSTLPAGSSDVELTFRVPNERDDAKTVSLQVFFPTDFPLLTVDVLPVPGWTAHVDTENSAKPAHTDDGPVTQVVRDVTWTATSGGIGAGQYEDFPIAAASVPDHPGQLVFKALQTYSSGDLVRWVEVPTAQVPQPDTPAPTLTLTATSSAHSGGATGVTTSGSSGTAEALAVAALAVAVVALVGVLVLLRRGRQHPR